MGAFGVTYVHSCILGCVRACVRVSSCAHKSAIATRRSRAYASLFCLSHAMRFGGQACSRRSHVERATGSQGMTRFSLSDRDVAFVASSLGPTTTGVQRPSSFTCRLFSNRHGVRLGAGEVGHPVPAQRGGATRVGFAVQRHLLFSSAHAWTREDPQRRDPRHCCETARKQRELALAKGRPFSRRQWPFSCEGHEERAGPRPRHARFSLRRVCRSSAGRASANPPPGRAHARERP